MNNTVTIFQNKKAHYPRTQQRRQSFLKAPWVHIKTFSICIFNQQKMWIHSQVLLIYSQMKKYSKGLPLFTITWMGKENSL